MRKSLEIKQCSVAICIPRWMRSHTLPWSQCKWVAMSSGVILHDTFLPKEVFLIQGNGMALNSPEPSWEVQQSQHFSGVAWPQAPLVAIVFVFCTQVLTNIVYSCCALTLPLFCLCLEWQWVCFAKSIQDTWCSKFNNSYLIALQGMIMLLAPARLRSSSSFFRTNDCMNIYIYFKITTTCMLYINSIHYIAMPRDTIWTLPDLGLVRQNQSPTSHLCIYTYPLQTAADRT